VFSEFHQGNKIKGENMEGTPSMHEETGNAYIKCEEFLDQVSYYELLKRKSVPWKGSMYL
jgi:hypothetical protein